jgi:Undecaprenyl-phosphate galactose phosphotransferase WbaP
MATKPAFAASSTWDLPRKADRSVWSTPGCILVSDFAALALVASLTVLGRHLLTPIYSIAACFQMMAFLTMFFPAFLVQGLYPGILIHPAEEMRRVFYSVCLVFFAWASIIFLLHEQALYSRSVFLVAWAVGAPAVLLFRHFTRRLLGGAPWWGIRAVILGSGSTAQRVARRLQNGALGVRVVGILSEHQVNIWPKEMPPVLGGFQLAPAIAFNRVAQFAIVAIEGRSSREVNQAIQDHCRGFSQVLLVPDMPGLCSLGIRAREVGHELGFELPQRLFQRSATILKRTLDLAMSCMLLALLSPLFGFIAIAIKLTSRGPVLFGHKRFGRDSEPFLALKFRTMVPDADRILANYLEAHPEEWLEWQHDHKLRNDPRITKLGKWLRRYSLDELPQLFNVVVGQMSLVGPRPIVEAEILKYGRSYTMYTRVLPGITGLWQISGRNNTTYDERVTFDEYYVYNWSIWLDLYILIRTVGVVLAAEGAY